MKYRIKFEKKQIQYFLIEFEIIVFLYKIEKVWWSHTFNFFSMYFGWIWFPNLESVMCIWVSILYPILNTNLFWILQLWSNKKWVFMILILVMLIEWYYPIIVTFFFLLWNLSFLLAGKIDLNLINYSKPKKNHLNVISIYFSFKILSYIII